MIRLFSADIRITGKWVAWFHPHCNVILPGRYNYVRAQRKTPHSAKCISTLNAMG